MDEGRHSVFLGSAIMVGLATLLFWFPILGPLLAGFLGGRKAGTPGRAVVAALIPAFAVGALFGFIVAVLPGIADWIGALFGIAVALIVAVQMALVMLGAFLGGAVESRLAPPSGRVVAPRGGY